MMNNRETVILIGASLLVAGMLFFLLFEIKEVPDLQWKENYAYSSKQPFGTWVFHQMLKERFSEIPVLTNQIDTNLASIESDKVLYLMISDQVNYGDSNTTALMDFVRKGNDALLITTDLLLGVDDEPYSFYWREFADTTITVHYVNTDVAFTYTHYEDDFFKAKSKFFTAFSGELSQDLDHEALGTVADSLIFYDQWNLGKGHLMVHTVPEMFCNQAAVQDQYREHFNFLFSTFDPELVILDHMNYHAESDLSDSPLQFILKNRSLRISYYLVLFMALSYIIFRGKRRQKIIPIVERNENTSLEYVATVSQLFEGQKQHKKLVRHLEDIFYHFTKKRYFLDRDLTDFGERLSRKSRISHEEIADLLFEFDRAKKKLNLGDDHLVILNKHLDSFYKNCK